MNRLLCNQLARLVLSSVEERPVCCLFPQTLSLNHLQITVTFQSSRCTVYKQNRLVLQKRSTRPDRKAQCSSVSSRSHVEAPPTPLALSLSRPPWTSLWFGSSRSGARASPLWRTQPGSAPSMSVIKGETLSLCSFLHAGSRPLSMFAGWN
jgi:hypothetical protein